MTIEQKLLIEVLKPSRLIEVVVPPLKTTYTYCINQDSDFPLALGSRVNVPLNGRLAVGYVIDPSKEPEEGAKYKVKAIEKIIHKEPCFNSTELELYKWISEYYCYPLSMVIDTAIPRFTEVKDHKWWHTNKDFDYSLIKGIKQKKIWEFIFSRGEQGAEHLVLNRLFPNSSSSIKSLLTLGAITESSKTDSPILYLESPIVNDDKNIIQLTSEQENVWQKISKALKINEFHSFLLHGITGSGKTEIYIKAAQEVLQLGGGIIILVPEIALTPQLIDRFRKQLPVPIALLHSSLSPKKRWESWKALADGSCQVALGARSTIFAPIKDLKLIIVDEEHDGSYKQSEGLRYNARDLALVRANKTKSTVILGSATPSVDTYFKARTGKIIYEQLKSRPFKGSSLEFEIVNLNKVKNSEMPSSGISPRLCDLISETLIKGQQSFILYNRRGFSRYMQCQACSQVVQCPNCTVPLTFHQSGNLLLCHYCSFSTTPSKFCPTCTDTVGLAIEPLLVTRGSGTQKITEELSTLFPSARIARLDRDSANNLSSLEKVLSEVRNNQVDILTGTQMIAKGHDLPNVTLVGVVDCDVGLHIPDFRAAERIFQLLTQVGGRAGRRDIQGKVLLQTRMPHHPCLQHTVNNSFEEFAKYELNLRKSAEYPPFSRLVRILASSVNESEALEYLQYIRKLIDDWSNKNINQISIIGPAKAPIEKIKARYRAHLILRSKTSKELRTIVNLLISHLKPNKGLRISYDFDPVDML